MQKITKSFLRDRVYDAAMEIIEGEVYDILDAGFVPSDLAGAAASIYTNMLKANTAKTGWIFDNAPVRIFTLGLDWKVRNSRPCFISCSDENATGVSTSAGCIFGRPYGPYGLPDEEDVKELLDMMNEAWYLLKTA